MVLDGDDRNDGRRAGYALVVIFVCAECVSSCCSRGPAAANYSRDKSRDECGGNGGGGSSSIITRGSDGTTAARVVVVGPTRKRDRRTCV